MSKRSRPASALEDINPQYLTLFHTSAAVDDYTASQSALPVTRIGASKNKAMVFEILSVDWYIDVDRITIFLDVTRWAFLSTGT